MNRSLLTVDQRSVQINGAVGVMELAKMVII